MARTKKPARTRNAQPIHLESARRNLRILRNGITASPRIHPEARSALLLLVGYLERNLNVRTAEDAS